MIGMKVLTPDIVRKRFDKLVSGGMDKRIMSACADTVVRDVQNHIRAQREITDQGGLPVNETGTLRRKARQGKPPLSLIDKGGLLKNTAYARSVTDNTATISLDPGMIGSEKGWWWLNTSPAKYFFFAISPSAQAAMFEKVVRLVRSLAFGK